MKVSIDLTPLYGRKKTGVELYAIDLYKALLNSNFEIYPIFHVKNEIDNNPNAKIIPKKNRLLLENFYLSRCVRLINPHLALFPIFPPPIDLYYCNTIKILPTIHDVAFLHFKKTLSIAGQYYLTPKILHSLKKSNAIITISESTKIDLLNFTKKKIFNLGENIAKEFKIENKKLEIDGLNKWGLKQNKYVISVSTIEPRKNLKYLIKTFSKYLKTENLKLVLVGRKGWGNDKELEDLIAQLSNNIIFTDYVPFEALTYLYQHAFAFALLSKNEGFGRTPFEAVACGCKRIILSDIPIFQENFAQNALFLPLNDVNLCEKIISTSEFVLVNENFKIPFHVIEERIHLLNTMINENNK